MKPELRNFLAILAGLIAGSALNMFIVNNSGFLIPLPEGYIPGNEQSLKEHIHLFEAKHYLEPFLAHALGTLLAAFVAVKLAIRRKLFVGIFPGIFFLVGGITAAVMFSIPFLPTLVDLVFAYVPFAWFGYKLAK